MAKYTNARYPEKVNDVIDNDGKIKAEALPVDPEPTVVNDYEGLMAFIDELSLAGEKLDVDRTFYFKDANPEDIADAIQSLDAEPVMKVILSGESYYDFCFNLVGSVRGRDVSLDNPYCLSGYIPVQIHMETDAETGDTQNFVEFGPDNHLILNGGLVSGTLRIKTIGENVEE